jgi:acyl carrier protein
MQPDFVLNDDDPLLERGVVDSMGIAEMLTFLDDEFGVKVADDEITEDNLGSLRAIATFVLRKRGAAVLGVATGTN